MALVLASALGALLACEVTARWADGGETGRRALLARLEGLADPVASFVGTGGRSDGGWILHPYTGSERFHDTGGVLAYFRDGAPEGEYTVLVVGGSVAAGWPREAGALFRERLEADPRLAGRRVRLLQYAHPSYKQPQQLMRVAWLFSLGYRPDAVVHVDGFNEVANGWEIARTGTHPLYPSAPVWGARLARADSARAVELVAELAVVRDAGQCWLGRLRGPLGRSSLALRVVRPELERLARRRASVQAELERLDAPQGRDPARQGPVFDAGFDDVLATCVRGWYEASLSLAAICRARDVPYVHCLQPALDDEGAKPLSAQERALPEGPDAWRPAVRAGYPLLRQAGQELVRRGVAFVDLSRLFADETGTVFTDPCHLRPEGYRRLAETLAEELLALLPR